MVNRACAIACWRGRQFAGAAGRRVELSRGELSAIRHAHTQEEMQANLRGVRSGLGTQVGKEGGYLLMAH